MKRGKRADDNSYPSAALGTGIKQGTPEYVRQVWWDLSPDQQKFVALLPYEASEQAVLRKLGLSNSWMYTTFQEDVGFRTVYHVAYRESAVIVELYLETAWRNAVFRAEKMAQSDDDVVADKGIRLLKDMRARPSVAVGKSARAAESRPESNGANPGNPMNNPKIDFGENADE